MTVEMLVLLSDELWVGKKAAVMVAWTVAGMVEWSVDLTAAEMVVL